ncbi:puromycin-sensitive aminopeptidase [Fusarium mundagurra]|uniref:Puromycin-sensitive aminopeptidase n=1 Tax=Fusarium mundagurra TaxID=1567541 RepID=A0A8H5YM13_9HYPO|nr:puromycin-sensitive aminopeptidase [Fusarium mundagurra]
MAQDVGGMPPPEGITPDFDGSSYLQRSIIVVYSCTFAIATVTLSLRLYSAVAIVRKVDWDIPLIILSWGGSLGFFIGVILALPSGFGKHLWDVRATSLPGYLNLLLVLGLTYVWPPTLAKLAILILYYRLIPNTGFRIGIYAVAAGLIIYTIVFTILLAWPCHPLKAGTETCIVNLTISQAVLNIVSDAIVIILPIPLIHRLKMPLKQRITAGVLLALGSAVVIISCIRFGYVQKMQHNPDITWTQASASQWSCIEMNTGIICNCLAHLKPFVRRHMPCLAKFVTRGSSGHESYPDEPGHGHSYKWRGDKASHGYQLHSVGRSQQPSSSEPDTGIRVVDEFQVEFTPSKDRGNASSTEDILRNSR